MELFKQHRARFIQALRQEAPNAVHIAVLQTAPEQLRNGDSYFPYRQDSHFYYLTGLQEPEAIALFRVTPTEAQFFLFNQPRDPVLERWNGPRTGQEGACQHYGADDAWPIAEFETQFLALLQDCDRLYFPLSQGPAFSDKILAAARQLATKGRSGARVPSAFHNLDPVLAELRLFKSPEEITLMQKAADISVTAHQEAMKMIRPGLYEYEVEAEILRTFYRHASRYPAYSSIVGSGKNGCTLHYVANNAVMQAGELVLIDAGAEYAGYAADITRTLPVNGHFSGPQRSLYEIVLQAQQGALKLIKPGCHWMSIQEEIVRIITQGLIDLEILQGSLDELIEKKAYSTFYMHNFGHWLGLDVHDVGLYQRNGQWRQLEAGMVLTVEPGLYISSGTGVATQWENIGIRIEDDVLVTPTGHSVLTAALPKTIEDIEHFMS